MICDAKTIARKLPRKAILLGAVLLLTATAPSFAQSYDPDLGAGNTAPPGITYGGGLREGSRYGGESYGGGFTGWNRSILNHRAQVLHHRRGHAKHHVAR